MSWCHDVMTSWCHDTHYVMMSWYPYGPNGIMTSWLAWLAWLSWLSWQHDIMTSWHHDIITSWHHDIMTSWHHDSMTSWHHDIISSWHHDSMTSWHHDIMASWTMTSWHHDIMPKGLLPDSWGTLTRVSQKRRDPPLWTIWPYGNINSCTYYGQLAHGTSQRLHILWMGCP
jgi:hypothetical protein